MRCITKLALMLALSISSAFAVASQTVMLDVKSVSCSSCAMTIKKALESVPGVEDAKIDMEKQTAIIKFDPAKANPITLMKAVTDAGFPATIHK